VPLDRTTMSIGPYRPICCVYCCHLVKPQPTQKPRFGGFLNPKPEFGKKAPGRPGLESLINMLIIVLI